MKKINIVLALIIISSIFLMRCSSFTSKENISIINQELIYDSINFKTKGFKVNIYSSLIFNKSSIVRKEYNDFLFIIKKDTFPLIPETNFLKKVSVNNSITVKYLSQINFKSEKFNNDSILSVIEKSSKIINSNGEEISKNDSFEIKSLITLHHRKLNGLKLQ